MSALEVLRAGPQMTMQDMGRSRTLALGLSRGGAADRLALLEAAALLSAPVGPAIEMAGMGGTFQADRAVRIALTGAPMRASCEGAPLEWNASHLLPEGAKLEIGPAVRGVYGYLSVGGGFATAEVMGSRSVHLNAGLGRSLEAGDRLPVGDDTEPDAPGFRLDPVDRFSGGDLRVVEGPHTSLYLCETIEKFANTTFTRSPQGNRQGVRLDHDGTPFATEDQLGLVSDVIIPGDIQMTGEGVPFVLLPECQTIGGYPRIGSVIPLDLPIIAQAPPGAKLSFTFVTLDEADALFRSETAQLRELRARVRRRLRHPNDIDDLLGYQLISGATRGDELDDE